MGASLDKVAIRGPKEPENRPESLKERKARVGKLLETAQASLYAADELRPGMEVTAPMHNAMFLIEMARAALESKPRVWQRR